MKNQSLSYSYFPILLYFLPFLVNPSEIFCVYLCVYKSFPHICCYYLCTPLYLIFELHNRLVCLSYLFHFIVSKYSLVWISDIYLIKYSSYMYNINIIYLIDLTISVYSHSFTYTHSYSCIQHI